MPDVEQWVNLTVNNRWIGEGLRDRRQMGELVRVQFQFAEAQRATVFVSKTALILNAVYSATERTRRIGFRPGEINRRRVRTNRDGVFVLRTRVTLAGGDVFLFEGEDTEGNTVSPDAIVTRRKLYYQVIGMAGVPLPGTAAFEREFWNTGDNLYIKLVQFSPGQTIPARVNLDDTVARNLNAVKRAARGQFDRTKRPYGVLILAVKKNCIRGWERVTTPGVIFNGVYALNTRRRLFDIADPAVEYYGSIRWRANTGGPWRRIAKTRCTRRGDFQVDIDTTGLPQAVPGRLQYRLRVIRIEGMGVSFASDNLILVATEEADGTAVPGGTLEAIIIHEMGHKIGMVPGPQGTRALDTQGTHYRNRGHSGAHCYHGTALVPNFTPGPGAGPVVPAPTPDCVMFGDIRSPTTFFCTDCYGSLRKLDLRSRTNLGLRRQF